MSESESAAAADPAEQPSEAQLADEGRSRPVDVFAGDVEEPVGEQPPVYEPPALEGKLVEVRYSGPFDEVELPLPNGATVRVKQGAYAKTTADHAKLLAEQDVWNVKGGSK